MRLLVLTEIPAPFRIPGFNALAATPGVELHVAVVAEHDPRRSYRVDPGQFAFGYHVLRGRSLRPGGRWLVLNAGLGRILCRVKPDAILIGGWNQPVFWQALVAARLRRIPAALWVESTARDARTTHGAAAAARGAALRLAAGFVVPGRASAEYLTGLGVDPATITVAPNAIEPGIVAAGHERPARPADECVFLYVGRLEREKGPDVLVRAMHDAPGRLVVVGDGSMRAELERAAPAGRVMFAGHAQREELAEWYADADVFVLPSRSDVWGMVLNEAAAAGLPIVASEVAGAAYDLIELGVNGLVVPSDDSAALAAALRQAGADPAWRSAAGRLSRELAQGLTPEAWAAAVAGLARDLQRQQT
jgi:glycosyltransferase involved in cell wall biosynthesis